MIGGICFNQSQPPRTITSHFTIIKCFCIYIFCMTGTSGLQLFFSSRQFHQRKRQRERFKHYSNCYVPGGCQISSACWLPLFPSQFWGLTEGMIKKIVNGESCGVESFQTQLCLSVEEYDCTFLSV